MNHSMTALALAAIATLTACSDDNDNDGEIRSLQSQLNALESALDSSNAALDETNSALLETQNELDALNATPVALAKNMGNAANRLPEDSDQVWRFAIFPDSQGRDDDNMRMTVNVDRDGNVLDIAEYVGVDFNGDGYYDAGTESQADNVKPGDWDEDGVSYLVNVMDPFQPFIETDASGSPIIVAPEDRKDYGPDWKILPLPLVEAVTDQFIELDVDLVLAIGDITEYRAESDYVQWMDKVAAPLREAGITYFPVRGNHEIINGRNWPAWFNNVQEWERQSVNNVYNDINPYEGYEAIDFDQGYALYQSYIGAIMQEHLAEGRAIGLPGAEDLVYYFVHNNTLFIALDYYFGELYSSAYRGTWIELHDWLTEVITSHAADVEHIVVFGHEPLSSKERPQTYNAEQFDKHLAERRALQAAVDGAQAAYADAVANAAPEQEQATLLAELEEAQGALDDLREPSLGGYDMGQLGYMLLHDESEPGLADKLLGLFTEYQVTYISGHDHQYTRSLIHQSRDDKDSARGFMQIIAGNASWKAYRNLYGINDEHETGLFISNFYDSDSGGDLFNSRGERYASITGSLGNGIAFLLVEVNGRQITTTAYMAKHKLTEVDMNLGAPLRLRQQQLVHL